MDNKWWQEFLQFFLREIDINRIFHLLLIFIVLVISLPASLKEAIDLHNPEVIPEHWMYYVLLFCISFFLSTVTRLISKGMSSFASDKIHTIKINSLSHAEQECLAQFLRTGDYVVYFRNHNPAVESLVKKGILVRTYDLNCRSNEDGYVIETKYNLPILQFFKPS